MNLAQWTLLSLVVLAGAPKDEPPTPEERIAELRADRADEHASLGAWAKGKKLGRAARAHFLTAIRLDPDCRRARSRLGHRMTREGTWDTSREREFETDTDRLEKYGDELAEKEEELLTEEAIAFEKLAVALAKEGREDLARDLFLHAHFLAPARETPPLALGLVRIERGFGTEEERVLVSRFREAHPIGGARFYGQLLGRSTETRGCGAVVAETARDASAAAKLAVLGQRAVIFTVKRFGLDALPPRWVWFAAPEGNEELGRFLSAAGMPQDFVARCVQLGTARMFRPRHCIAVSVGMGADPVNFAANFLHMAVEHVLWTAGGGQIERVPAWLHEAVGVDACLTLLGKPGTVCVVFEESQGLVTKEGFTDESKWPGILHHRAALGDLPRFELMRTAQVQALSSEDLIAAHAYYRLLVTTRGEGLPKYLEALGKNEPELDAFRAAFGTTHEEITKELTRAILGG